MKYKVDFKLIMSYEPFEVEADSEEEAIEVAREKWDYLTYSQLYEREEVMVNEIEE